MRTVASGVDLLAVLFEKRSLFQMRNPSQARILVVDDEAISRRAMTYALEKAKLKSVCVEGAAAALEKLADHHYDLILLDVDMPEMNGFELCTKLRTMDAHKKTPVVFVTNLTDFESRANSTMSGGTDLIAKPFLFIELAVKALVHLLRARFTPTTKA
jgi:DNA-binding response OmpR family regulator